MRGLAFYPKQTLLQLLNYEKDVAPLDILETDKYSSKLMLDSQIGISAEFWSMVKRAIITNFANAETYLTLNELAYGMRGKLEIWVPPASALYESYSRTLTNLESDTIIADLQTITDNTGDNVAAAATPPRATSMPAAIEAADLMANAVTHATSTGKSTITHQQVVAVETALQKARALSERVEQWMQPIIESIEKLFAVVGD